MKNPIKNQPFAEMLAILLTPLGIATIIYMITIEGDLDFFW
ncbi:hypothetical protein [Kaistella palustris]|nr:hypothetical protein [Kaistella palustris]